MKKVLTGLLLVMAAIGIMGCSKKISVVTTSQNQLLQASGFFDDSDVSVNYDQSNDTVNILAQNINGTPLPLTFFGIRVGEVSIGQAREMCSILGFNNLSDTSFATTLSSTSRIIENDGGYSDWTHLKKSKYPVLHIMPIANSLYNAFFDFLPEVSSYYFTENHKSQKLYVHSLTCSGTTQAHFGNDNNFNQDDFFKGVLQGQLGTYIQSTENIYKQSSYFLVKKAKEIWIKEEAERGGVMIKPEANFLSAAKEGATDICLRSGFNGLLFYSVKYMTSLDLPKVIYQYDNENKVWIESSVPSAYKISYTFDDQYRDVKHTIEVPSVFLDNIYCF